MQNFIHQIRSRKEAAGSWRQLLLHTSVTLALTSALSYALGLARDKSFAYKFGAGWELDVYNASFVVPDFLFAILVSGALSAAFVPIFTSLDEKDRQRALTYTNQVLSFMLVFLTAFSLIFALLLPLLVDYLVPGFSQEQKLAYVMTTRVLLIAPFFFTFSNTFGNALLSTRDFLWYGLAPVLYNAGIIMGIWLLVPIWGLQGLVVGTVAGSGLHMLIRAQAMWRYGFRPKVSLLFSAEMRETLTLMLPKMAQIGMWQIMLWWFILLASQAGEGSVTIYNFAYNFQSVPVSLIGISIALASFSQLSHLSAHNDLKSFGELVRKESLRVLVLTTLAGLALGLASRPLINLLLGGGRFTPEAVDLTVMLLRVYVISVPLESLMHLLARAHYALKDTLRPSVIHVGAIVASIAISALLLPQIGLYALPVAFSSGFLLQCIFLSLSLWQLLKQKSYNNHIS